MTLSLSRLCLTSSASAVLLSVVLAGGASAQVATLADPDESPDPEAATTGTVVEYEDREEAMLAYAQCMREHGIDMDDPQPGEGGGSGIRGFLRLAGGDGRRTVDRFGEEFRAAQRSCSSILEAARPEVDPEAEQERLEEQLALAECIRQHGYPEYPDPTIGTSGRLERVGGREMREIGIDNRSEEFRETTSTCLAEMGLEESGLRGGAGRARRGD